MIVAQCSNDVKGIHFRHAHVEPYQVRALFLYGEDCFRSGRAFRYDVNARLGLQHFAKAFPRQTFIVSNHHLQCHGTC